jgi:hypothetical protein
LNRAIDLGRSCFDRFANGAAAPEPACKHSVRRRLWLPLRTPWTKRDAIIVGEELEVRWAIAAYVDAAVGALSTDSLRARFADVLSAQQQVEKGTGRFRLDVLGPPIPAPEPGELAFLVGDRRALDERAFDWTQHYTERHAMAAALLENRAARALRLAEHYHGRPNTDERIVVGALECLAKDASYDVHARALGPVIEVEHGRARKRDANFERNFGDARVVIEACSQLHGKAAPEIPTTGPAGKMDRYEQLMALRLRHWADECDPQHLPGKNGNVMQQCRQDEATATNLEHVERKLEGEEPLRYRLELVALMVPAFDEAPPILRLMRSRNAERPHTARVPWTIDEWIERDGPDEPFLPPHVLDAAAARLGELAVAGDTTKDLTTLAAVLRMRAAKGYAQRGDVARAEAALAAGLVGLAPLKGQAQLARSSMEWLLGRHDRAIAILDAASVSSAADRARVRLQRAQLLLPDKKAALVDLLAAKQDAQGDADLTERIRWLLLAAGYEDGSVSQPSDPLAAPRLGEKLGVSPQVRAQKMNEAIAIWQSWLAAPELRVSRYRAYRARGDAPRESLAAYLLAASRLAGDGDAERWLDAFFAIDATRVPLVHQAWIRHLAARWRGDETAAAAWHTRFTSLMRLANDPRRADLWLAAGI